MYRFVPRFFMFFYGLCLDLMGSFFINTDSLKIILPALRIFEFANDLTIAITIALTIELVIELTIEVAIVLAIEPNIELTMDTTIELTIEPTVELNN